VQVRVNRVDEEEHQASGSNNPNDSNVVFLVEPRLGLRVLQAEASAMPTSGDMVRGSGVLSN
jgi:hypothetical protein